MSISRDVTVNVSFASSSSAEDGAHGVGDSILRIESRVPSGRSPRPVRAEVRAVVSPDRATTSLELMVER